MPIVYFNNKPSSKEIQREMMKEAISLLVLEGVFNSENYARLALRKRAIKNINQKK